MTEDVRALLAALYGDAPDPSAGEALLAMLRCEAHRLLRREPANSLQTTALAHEVYLRVLGMRRLDVQNATHLRRLLARVMRQVLVDHARTRRAQKRGGGWVRAPFDEARLEADHPDTVDVLALHEALQQLHDLDPQTAEVVQLRVFGGATLEEVACALQLARRRVSREWSFALTWLRKTLSSTPCEGRRRRP